jgi:hypothetical protein
VSREAHAGFCERRRVKLPPPTLLAQSGALAVRQGSLPLTCHGQAVIDLPESQQRQHVPDRRVIPATCSVHRGPVGFTNLVVSRREGTIVLDPHAVGSCVISLDEQAATSLCDALTEWLGRAR